MQSKCNDNTTNAYIEGIIANETLQYNRDIDQIQAIENGTVDKL